MAGRAVAASRERRRPQRGRATATLQPHRGLLLRLRGARRPCRRGRQPIAGARACHGLWEPRHGMRRRSGVVWRLGCEVPGHEMAEVREPSDAMRWPSCVARRLSCVPHRPRYGLRGPSHGHSLGAAVTGHGSGMSESFAHSGSTGTDTGDGSLAGSTRSRPGGHPGPGRSTSACTWISTVKSFRIGGYTGGLTSRRLARDRPGPVDEASENDSDHAERRL